MNNERFVSQEAQALERIVRAAREVYAASTALQADFGGAGSRQASMLELVKFAAAMQELKEAREAFDALVSSKHANETKAGGEAFTGQNPQQ